MPPLLYYDLFILARTAFSQPCFTTLNSMHADMYAMKESQIGCSRDQTKRAPLLVKINAHGLLGLLTLGTH